ncbi:MAG: hypothetical protein JXA93_11905 [Anaerolineae bacterium]|nr:hypothetical protein [Anaerolineae bacterium]
MNPLSPLTYYRRHKRQALLLAGLIALAVMGVYMLLGLFQESFVTPDYTVSRYLSKFSVVQAAAGSALDPTVADEIRVRPGVAHVLPQKNVEVAVPNLGGLGFYFRLFGLHEADAGTVLARSGVSLVDGELPRPGSHGVALSREIAAGLELEIGDTFDRTADDGNDFFARFTNIAEPMEVVGILSGDVRLGIVSYEYLDGHASYLDTARDGLLVITHQGHEETVDDYLQALARPGVEVHTDKLLKETIAEGRATLMALFVPGILLVTVAVTLVVGAINQLAFMRRLPEFGTLHAVGRSRGWLARRLTLETAGLTVAGWAVGIAAALGGMAVVSNAVYAPKGFPFEPFLVPALLITTPVPIAVIGFTLLTALRALGRLDAVAIVERGELSLEKAGAGRTQRALTKRLPRPLSVTTFYRRHTGRAATLIAAMALMIVGTALIVFVFDSVMDGGQPAMNALRRVSHVSLFGVPAEEEAARIAAHPAVERVVPATTITPLALVVPLIRDDSPLETYGVTADDLAYLVQLYGLELAEGHLPRPGSHEIVIPWTASKNRDLRVGDVIGDPARAIYSDAPALPVPLVVSGIFRRPQDPAEDVWLSFTSRETVDGDPALWNAGTTLLIVPQAGQKAALDDWLDNEIADDQRMVLTAGMQQEWFDEAMTTGLFAISLMESIIAVVAALGLAGLNYLFVTQRHAEFGVLNALGQSRRQLVQRVTRETLFTTGAAWLLGLAGCAAVLAVLHYQQYAPLGLRLDFFNLTPWLYTLPIPAAVIAASAATAAWMLSRLDPVALIERRD